MSCVGAAGCGGRCWSVGTHVPGIDRQQLTTPLLPAGHPSPPSLPQMVHCARFFYGPMLQGRDGIGAAPCCGTGVVFRRDVLVSIGGQSYGSITEDYNTGGLGCD